MAVPNPEQELARLQSILGGDVPPVLVIQGPCQWFKNRALDLVRGAFGARVEISELDGTEAGTSEAEAGRFLVDLRTPSLFGAHKILLLRNAEAWLRQHAGPLAETVERVASGNLLVLVAGKLDGRTALARRIKKHGDVFEFRNLYDKPFGGDRPAAGAELVQWLGRRARVYGIQLSPEAGLFMMEVAGSDPGQLDAELTRLQPLLSSQTVTPATLRGVLTVSFGSDQFELVDAILAGDARGALRSLRALYRGGLRDKSGKPIEQGSIFPIVSSWLLNSLSKLMEARAELDSGAHLGEVVAGHGGYFKDRFARQLQTNDVAGLVDLLGALRRAERRLRTTSESPEILLERLVCETLLPVRRHLLGREGSEW